MYMTDKQKKIIQHKLEQKSPECVFTFSRLNLMYDITRRQASNIIKQLQANVSEEIITKMLNELNK